MADYNKLNVHIKNSEVLSQSFFVKRPHQEKLFVGNISHCDIAPLESVVQMLCKLDEIPDFTNWVHWCVLDGLETCQMSLGADLEQNLTHGASFGCSASIFDITKLESEISPGEIPQNAIFARRNFNFYVKKF